MSFFHFRGKKVEVVILSQGVDTTFEEDLVKDLLEIITVFRPDFMVRETIKIKRLLRVGII